MIRDTLKRNKYTTEGRWIIPEPLQLGKWSTDGAPYPEDAKVRELFDGTNKDAPGK